MPRHPIATTQLTRVLLIAAVGVVGVGCTTFDASSDDDVDGPAGRPQVTVTIPAVRLTPFCQAMIDLAERLENDPPADTEAAIIETYEEIEPEVPAAIREDFEAVLAALRGEGPTIITDPADDPLVTTTFDLGPPVTDESGATSPAGDPFFDEGYQPGDTPALRLNAYVDFECRDVANNPGPPPTQPLGDVVATTDG